MKCIVCGRNMRETRGVHYIKGKWLLSDAWYCCNHGSYILSPQLQQAEEVIPDPTQRTHIRPGLHVLVVLKEDQVLQKPIEGFVRNILTKSLVHNRGIKVRLLDGQVGRVVKILR